MGPRGDLTAALADLVDGLMTFFIAFPTVLSLQMFFFWYWRYRMNRGYYDELYLPQEVWDRKKAMIEAEGKFVRKWWCCFPLCWKVPKVARKPKKKKFIALPGPFVFPALPLLCTKFFISSIIGHAANLALAGEECDLGCHVLAYSCLACSLAFIVSGWLVIILCRSFTRLG